MIARLLNGLEIDFPAFGSHWLAHNQLSHGSYMKGVTRMPPNSIMTLSADGISLKNDLWIPDSSSSTPEEFIGLLKQFLWDRIEIGLTVSFGLSGGLDSRFLLALLVSEKPDSLALHLFGHPEEPDVRIAKEIARCLALPQEFFDEPLPNADECVRGATEFSRKVHGTVPASGLLKQDHYPKLVENSSDV